MKKQNFLTRMLLLLALIVGSVNGAWAVSGPDLNTFTWPTPLVDENFSSAAVYSTTKEKHNPTVEDYNKMGAFNGVYCNKDAASYGIENTVFGTNALFLTPSGTSPVIASITNKTFGEVGAFSFKTNKTTKGHIGIYKEKSGTAISHAKAAVYLNLNAGQLQISSGSAWVSIGTYNTTEIDVCIIYNCKNEAQTYGNSIALAAKQAHVYVNGACVMDGENPKAFAIPQVTSTDMKAFRVVAANSTTVNIDDVKIYNELPTYIPYSITAQSNDNEKGTVSLVGNKITATPTSGNRINLADPYTVSPAYAAEITRENNVFIVKPSEDCTVTINFEAVAPCTVTLSDDTGTPLTEASANAGVVLPARSDAGDYSFVGWSETELTSEVTTATIIPAGIFYPENNITLYPVYGKTDERATPELLLNQTMTYDTWTYNGNTTDKSSYRMFSKDSYIESNDFDLSKLYKVIVYGGGSFGTIPDGQKRQFTISDGTTNWAVVETDGTSQTKAREVTSNIVLSGNGKIRVISDFGAAGESGLRFTKVEIFTRATLYTSYPTESVTVTSAGLATYVSDYALDYTGKSISAYIAKEEAGKIKMYQVNKVPAGTGVLLKADGGATVDIPVTTEATDDVTGNLFKRGNDAAVESGSGSGPYNYILNNIGGKVGFYRANSKTVAKNRAYLQTTIDAPAAGRLSIVFDDEADETTGISEVKDVKADAAIYNLNGVRVKNMTKGLYIMNGKKMIVK